MPTSWGRPYTAAPPFQPQHASTCSEHANFANSDNIRKSMDRFAINPTCACASRVANRVQAIQHPTVRPTAFSPSTRQTPPRSPMRGHRHHELPKEERSLEIIPGCCLKTKCGRQYASGLLQAVHRCTYTHKRLQDTYKREPAVVATQPAAVVLETAFVSHALR